MYITKIEIDGFKSYGTPQCLQDMDTQFNAITGLNGSGKSNILDSICFLLGINNLQYIRADNNEDLVFRKGQSGVTKATVTITFDNQNPKQKPLGYENDKTIVIRRQVVLNGKQTYHINGAASSASKVSDLFNSVSMNVNNPHFLIMQGRVTKVLNMKPREVLFMVEEAAGVRVYEAKRVAAMMTIEKKAHKIDNMNRMMDEEILPRLNKLRGERDLYNEYLKLGRDIEQQERLQICFEFWRARYHGIRYREALAAREEENAEAKVEIQKLKEKIQAEERELEKMQKHYDEVLGQQEVELSAACRHKENELVDKRSELKKAEEEIKELESRIKQQTESITQDKYRLEKKKTELENAQNRHGNDATRKKEALKQLEQCKAVLAALERGLVTDEDGKETSLSEQLLNVKNKHSREETMLLRINSNLEDFRNKLKRAESDLATAGRKSAGTLELKRSQVEDEIKKIQDEAARFERILEERDGLNAARRQLTSEIRQKQDKMNENLGAHLWLNFKYRTPPQFNEENVHGPLATLIFPKSNAHLTALETALGAILMHIVVKTRETAQLLLKQGQLVHRYTFIPLDNIQYRMLDYKKYERAVQLVGEDNVFRAIDLVDFDECNRKAVEHALGSVLICTTPDAAKTVCFHPQIRARVVTLDGDDYKPDGFLSGGKMPNRRNVLVDIYKSNSLKQDIEQKNKELENIEQSWTRLQKTLEKKNELEERLNSKNFELSEINENIRMDPLSRLRTEIHNLNKQIKEKEAELNKVQPVVDDLSAKLQVLEERQRNEVKYRRAEENKARKGIEEAEKTLSSLEKSSSTAIDQLELARLDVETLAKQIEDDEEMKKRELEKRGPMKAELLEYKNLYEATNVQFEEAKRNFDEFVVKYRQYEREIKQKQQRINDLKKEEREKINSEANYERDRREYEEKATDCEKAANLIERQHSWIADEKENFNKPGTQYDFKDLTVRKIQEQVRSMRERREELDRRVNIEAMRSLAEEEERANDLDSKRKAIHDDRDLLQKTIYEIDSEKKRELELACKKISKDFGAIFSTILPGATAKLNAVDKNDLTQGLQICVGFNDQWKESLDELSGGQRSLVALSLILAMLKCNPAPIYILDEVDAALDLSHTSNIGTMIKQHFKQSQFIIVSLKEGMFNNANVIYRTQFVNGTSKVTRTENKH